MLSLGMNLYLHGLEPHIHLGDTIYEPDRGERFDCILTNPPFGTKGASQVPEREYFTIATSNKHTTCFDYSQKRWACGSCVAG